MGQEEYQELASFLRRFIRRLILVQGLEGLCLTAVCALILFALGPGIKELTRFLPYAPVVYSAGSAIVLLMMALWTIYRFARRPSAENAALYIERKEPQLRNNLINSLQLYPQVAAPARGSGFSTSMILALLRSTRKQIAALRVGDLIETQRLRRSAGLLGIVFAPVLGAVLFNPSWVGETYSLLTRPLEHLPPMVTTIELEPKNLRVVRGARVRIEAATSGAIAESVHLLLTPEKGAGARDAEKLVMEKLGGGKFALTIPKLDRSLRYRAVTGNDSSPEYLALAVDPPEIADIRSALFPPAYAGLAAVNSSGGNVEGLKGSTVRLEATATKDVVKGELILDDGKRVPLKLAGRKLQANLVLFQSQRYRIVVEDAFGFQNSPIAYDLRAKPDGFPTVDLLAPTEDLEVSGDEVMPIEYSARDDFGIGEINLVVKVGDREEKIALEREERRNLVMRGQFKWDLGRLALREGDEAVFHLQVLDNDTISGPKLGTSKSLRLRLKNLKAEHRQLAQMIEDLNSRMVDALADHLESPPPGEKDAAASSGSEQKLEKTLDDALKRTEEVLQRTAKDRMSDFATFTDLEALKRNLQFTRDELLQRQQQARSGDEKLRAREEISSELERMSLLSEDISKRLKSQEAASTAQDLARSQERLMDALDKLQTGDKNLDAIMQQINELAKTLASLQQALSQMAQQMPDEFMNAESMRSLGFDEMFSQLDAIRKKLMEGDLEGARQLARELFNQMASMVAALQNSQRQSLASNMGRMQGEMQRSNNELQQIAREQQEILLGTEGVNNSALSARDSSLKEKLDRFLEKAVKELGRLTLVFPDREGGDDDPDITKKLDETTMNQLVKNLIAKLLARDFPGYGEGDTRARNELEKPHTPEQKPKVELAEKTLDNVKSELDALIGEPASAMNDAQRKTVRDLGQRQSALQERTEELHEKLESLFQLFPSLDPKILQGIKEAGGSMGSAAERLGKLDSPGAVPPERSALERLSQSQQQMQSAMQQMAQRGQLGNMPVTRLFRQGRFMPGGMLTPLPGTPQFPQFDVEGGVTGLEMERFRLPGKEDYRAPRNFREEILESLKQGVPPQMKDQIERYFKNLSE
jgi:soluble cytochrome b562